MEEEIYQVRGNWLSKCVRALNQPEETGNASQRIEEVESSAEGATSAEDERVAEDASSAVDEIVAEDANSAGDEHTAEDGSSADADSLAVEAESLADPDITAEGERSTESEPQETEHVSRLRLCLAFGLAVPGPWTLAQRPWPSALLGSALPPGPTPSSWAGQGRAGQGSTGPSWPRLIRLLLFFPSRGRGS